MGRHRPAGFLLGCRHSLMPSRRAENCVAAEPPFVPQSFVTTILIDGPPPVRCPSKSVPSRSSVLVYVRYINESRRTASSLGLSQHSQRGGPKEAAVFSSAANAPHDGRIPRLKNDIVEYEAWSARLFWPSARSPFTLRKIFVAFRDRSMIALCRRLHPSNGIGTGAIIVKRTSRHSQAGADGIAREILDVIDQGVGRPFGAQFVAL